MTRWLVLLGLVVLASVFMSYSNLYYLPEAGFYTGTESEKVIRVTVSGSPGLEGKYVLVNLGDLNLGSVVVTDESGTIYPAMAGGQEYGVRKWFKYAFAPNLEKSGYIVDYDSAVVDVIIPKSELGAGDYSKVVVMAPVRMVTINVRANVSPGEEYVFRIPDYFVKKGMHLDVFLDCDPTKRVPYFTTRYTLYVKVPVPSSNLITLCYGYNPDAPAPDINIFDAYIDPTAYDSAKKVGDVSLTPDGKYILVKDTISTPPASFVESNGYIQLDGPELYNKQVVVRADFYTTFRDRTWQFGMVDDPNLDDDPNTASNNKLVLWSTDTYDYRLVLGATAQVIDYGTMHTSAMRISFIIRPLGGDSWEGCIYMNDYKIYNPWYYRSACVSNSYGLTHGSKVRLVFQAWQRAEFPQGGYTLIEGAYLYKTPRSYDIVHRLLDNKLSRVPVALIDENSTHVWYKVRIPARDVNLVEFKVGISPYVEGNVYEVYDTYIRYDRSQVWFINMGGFTLYTIYGTTKRPVIIPDPLSTEYVLSHETAQGYTQMFDPRLSAEIPAGVDYAYLARYSTWGGHAALFDYSGSGSEQRIQSTHDWGGDNPARDIEYDFRYYPGEYYVGYQIDDPSYGYDRYDIFTAIYGINEASADRFAPSLEFYRTGPQDETARYKPYGEKFDTQKRYTHTLTAGFLTAYYSGKRRFWKWAGVYHTVVGHVSPRGVEDSPGEGYVLFNPKYDGTWTTKTFFVFYGGSTPSLVYSLDPNNVGNFTVTVSQPEDVSVYEGYVVPELLPVDEEHTPGEYNLILRVHTASPYGVKRSVCEVRYTAPISGQEYTYFSDINGDEHFFSLEFTEEGLYEINYECHAFLTEDMKGTIIYAVVVPDPEVPELRVVAEYPSPIESPTEANVLVTLTDLNESPVSGASCYLEYDRTYYAETNSDGIALFTLTLYPDTTFNVYCWKEGYHPVFATYKVESVSPAPGPSPAPGGGVGLVPSPAPAAPAVEEGTPVTTEEAVQPASPVSVPGGMLSIVVVIVVLAVLYFVLTRR